MANPDQDDVLRILSESDAQWHGYLNKAKSQDQFISDLISPSNLLYKVPAFPPKDCMTHSASTHLLTSGQATWTNSRQSGCSLENEKVMVQELTIGVSRPTTCSLKTSHFLREMDGSDISNQSKPRNHIAILTLAWAYILSKCQIERQDGRMKYSDNLAPFLVDGIDRTKEQSASFIVSVGDVDAEEVRWWRAVLAPGQGWFATLLPSLHLSPWSVSYGGSSEFIVTSFNIPSSAISSQPPSCHQALDYLSKFISRYSLESQSTASLAATLVLPLHNSLLCDAQLPFPGQPSILQRTATKLDYSQERRNLPYYMTLSCTAPMLGSALWSVFWQSSIDSNLVSAWFTPIIGILAPIIESGQDELLIKILALRRPQIGPLWLGAVLTGFSKFILPYLRTLDAPYTRPNIVTSAWTGSSQSFIEEYDSGPYIHAMIEESSSEELKPIVPAIRRVDRWRILFDVGQPPYDHTPLAPWQPFGYTPCASCETDVRAHERCTRHQRIYKCWTWLMKDGVGVVDRGFAQSSPHTQQPFELFSYQPSGSGAINIEKVNDTASAAATYNIFSWNSVNGEGYSPSDRSIFEHEWLIGLLSEDSDGTLMSSASSNRSN